MYNQRLQGQCNQPYVLYLEKWMGPTLYLRIAIIARDFDINGTKPTQSGFFIADV